MELNQKPQTYWPAFKFIYSTPTKALRDELAKRHGATALVVGQSADGSKDLLVQKITNILWNQDQEKTREILRLEQLLRETNLLLDQYKGALGRHHRLVFEVFSKQTANLDNFRTFFCTHNFLLKTLSAEKQEQRVRKLMDPVGLIVLDECDAMQLAGLLGIASFTAGSWTENAFNKVLRPTK